MKKITYLIISLLVILSSSCNRKQEAEKKNQKVTQKELIIPTDLEIYRPIKSYLMDSNQIATSAVKVYISINLSCPTCINKISKWNELITTLGDTNRIPFIIIGNADDRFESIKYLYKTGKMGSFPYPFFLDKRMTFYLKNKVISEYGESNAIVTDVNNNIIFYDNPLESSQAALRFTQAIKKLPK